MLNLCIVEDNLALRKALKSGLEATWMVKVVGETARGEDVLAAAAASLPNPGGGGPADPAAGDTLVVLMDVALAGEMNGIQAAVALRREYPRLPVVFYSIQDDENYYRDFLRSGILSHYAYVRKSNYLLPVSIVPLLRTAAMGGSLIDPEIASRVQEVRKKDENDPLALLEPNERSVVALLAQGLTNEQIAQRLGYRDARAVSRTNGQIYAAWGLDSSGADEKVARTRAAIIFNRRQLVVWDAEGRPFESTLRGETRPIS